MAPWKLRPLFHSANQISHLSNPIPPYHHHPPFLRLLWLHKWKSQSRIKEIHAQTIVSGFSDDPHIISQILPSCELDHAFQIFSHMKNPSTFLWNCMIQAYSKSNSPELAIIFFRRMLDEGQKTNIFVYPSLIGACGHLSAFWEGTQIHSHVLKKGFDSDSFLQSSLIHMYSSIGIMEAAQTLFDEMPQGNVVVWTALVNGYSKVGDLENARQIFDRIPEKDAIAWSAMISGYVQSGWFQEGLCLFKEMLVEGMEANESVLVSVLSACGHLGALEMGKWVHLYVERRFGSELSVNLGTSLVDMYAKCGVLSAALEAFQDMSCKNVWSWNVMMGGFAIYGHGRGALGVLGRMSKVGVRPDEVTFLALLGALSHGGMVDEGRVYFSAMSKVFFLKPLLEHYSCMVDLYARAGFLEEAKELVQTMPVEPDAPVWGALLGGCRVHGNLRLGSEIGHRLIEFEPNCAGRYMLLSNIYAAAGRWDESKHLRVLMNVRGVRAQAGFSSIEVEGLVHVFVAGDRKHPLIREIYDKLEEMFKGVSNAGYIVDTRNVLYDLDEEDKELQLSYHSEKLAIAFGLISTENGTAIRIVKNLRVCGDCHAMTKLLSRIYRREIVVRDRKRFHHFKDGSCSCLDYW